MSCAVHVTMTCTVKLHLSLSLSLSHTHQEVISEFIHTQLAFHAKALELYTLAYQHTQAISEEEAVEVSIQIKCWYEVNTVCCCTAIKLA